MWVCVQPTERAAVLGDEPHVVAPQRDDTDGKHDASEEQKQDVKITQPRVRQPLQHKVVERLTTPPPGDKPSNHSKGPSFGI